MSNAEYKHTKDHHMYRVVVFRTRYLFVAA